MARRIGLWRRRLSAGSAALALSLTVGGCAPDVDGYCQERADCVGGNDKDVEACAAYVDTGEELAAARGCGSEYSDYVECVIDASSCDDQDIGAACNSDADCEPYAQAGAVNCSGGQCEIKQYTLKNDAACDAAARVFNACGGGGLIDDGGL
jgi:hypothetical protein